jgi:hypothetical protein
MSIRFAPIQAVVMFVFGIAVGGGLLAGAPQQAQAIDDPVATKGVTPTCSSGDAVADFVCRNTWLAMTKHSYR